MDTDTYNKEFKPWYTKLVAENQNDWNFRDEMVKYCRADVELLSKAVLAFRIMFKDRLDIDPFRYVTLASLCMAIFRGCVYLINLLLRTSKINKCQKCANNG